MQATNTFVSSSSVRKSNEQVVRNLKKSECKFKSFREKNMLKSKPSKKKVFNSAAYPSGINLPQIFNIGRMVKGIDHNQVRKHKNKA